jgi:uncharacterized protein
VARIYKSKAMEALHQNMRDLHQAGAIDAVETHKYDDICLSGVSEPGTSAHLSYQIFKDRSGAWRWRLMTAQGKVIASSGEGYETKLACLATIELVKQSGSAPIAA